MLISGNVNLETTLPGSGGALWSAWSLPCIARSLQSGQVITTYCKVTAIWTSPGAPMDNPRESTQRDHGEGGGYLRAHHVAIFAQSIDRYLEAGLYVRKMAIIIL